MESRIIVCGEDTAGKRIDAFLGCEIEGKSRSFFQKMIESGEVKVNGKEVKSKYKIKEGDNIEILDREPVQMKAVPEDIPINIIYEDEDVVVVNKEKDMVVHPAPGNYDGTLVNALLYHCDNLSGINGVIRPGIVHRIDKDTSGILVIAKNDNSHVSLGDQFKEHSVERTYYALVEGVVKKDEGTISKSVARDKKTRIKMSVDDSGKRAVTHYEVLHRYNKHTLVKCNLETGRTHQIRVHMAWIGHPLVGDKVYGFAKQKFNTNGQMLHAKTLGFIHPSTQEYIEFDSELPDYFKNILMKLERMER